MTDLLILGALTFWLVLWAARDLGWCGTTRRQASAMARRSHRHPRCRSLTEDGIDGVYVDALGRRS